MLTLHFVRSLMRVSFTSLFGEDCTPEDFPDVALEDTPHYNKFDNVNIDLHHQEKEWLEQWQKFTGEEAGNMEDEHPWVVTGADPEVATP